MVDLTARFRQFLVLKITDYCATQLIASPFGTRIWGASNPIPGWVPATGTCLVFNPRGGTGAQRHDQTFDLSFATRVIGADGVVVAEADALLFSAIQGKRSRLVKKCVQEMPSSFLVDPQTLWPEMFGAYATNLVVN